MSQTEKAAENDRNLGVPLIKVSEIFLDHEFNCRGHFAASDCVELAKDIAVRGLQQPVTVRKLREKDIPEKHLKNEMDIIGKGFRYKMIAGHRRLMAYRINQTECVPAFIKPEDLPEFEARDLNAIENLQRKELNLFQEAVAVKHYWMAGWNRQEVADRVGKSPGWVQIRFMLLDMPEQIQIAAAQGYLTQEDIRELNKYEDAVQQLKMAGMIRDRRKAGQKKNITNLIRKKDAPNSKKHRKREQLFEMIHHLQETLYKVDGDVEIKVAEIVTPEGNCLSTRILAWAAGEITTLEVHQSIRDFCEALGYFYEIPEFAPEDVAR